MTSKYDVMWTEKYRPKTLDDLRGHEDIIIRLKGFVERKNLPHLLFAGPPGTGKTSALLALAIDLYGHANVSRNLLEMNASDDRGIDAIRTKVKEFARTASYGDIPFKIICLDEADSLTSAAQHALRRTMERYVKTSRFALICNYSSKIIEPIQSRCAIFRFKPLDEKSIREFLKYICDNEKLVYDEEGLSTVLYICEGDLRKAVNILQSTAASGKSVERITVLKTVGHADPERIKEMLSLALSGKFEKSREVLQQLILEFGLSGTDVTHQIYREISSLSISDNMKLEVTEFLAEIDFRISEGASSNIQLTSFLAKLVKESNKE
ncbi:MAG: replication factor C small subunit [Candidatus Heimdallarchaeota archaeon]|nr:replication factor C small subunit [Candidatus Heimdallarchaeota archaeon]